MNRMLMIFRKDVAHLWPQIVAFLATLVAFACNDPTYTKHEGDGEYAIFLGVLLPLACWLLVTSLFQDEGAVGREPYWLTRPFTSTDLLLEKAFFLFAFVTLPVFVVQAIVLAVNDLPPLEHLGDLIIRNIFLASWLIVPTAAIATLTKRAAHALLGTLMVVMPLSFGLGLGPRWLALSVAPLLLLGGSVAVIFLQFTQRRTERCQVLFGVTVAATIGSFFLPAAWARDAESWYWDHNRNAQALQITLDPERTATSCENAEYCIPIRIDHLPRGAVVPVMTAIDTSSLNGVPLEWRHEIVNNGPPQDWLVTNDASHRLDIVQNRPIHIKGSLAMRLVEPTLSAQRVCLTNSLSLPYSPSPWFGPIEFCDGNDIWHYIHRSFDLGPLRLADYLVEK